MLWSDHLPIVLRRENIREGKKFFGGGTCGKYDKPLNCRSGRRNPACHSERSSAALPVILSEVEWGSVAESKDLPDKMSVFLDWHFV